MYSLDVNFLKDRHLAGDERDTVQAKSPTPSLNEQLPILIGAALLVLLPALAGALLLLVNWQTARAQKNIEVLDAELNALGIQNQQKETLQQQITAINDETKALVSVFNQIQSWSAILQEIRQQTPAGVQVNSIQQADSPGGEGGLPSSKLTITGYARNYNDVNDFVLTLQGSEFFNAQATKLQGAQLTAAPIELDAEKLEAANVSVELPQVVQYTVSTEVKNTPASQLIQPLARNGAIGLVTRIRTLEQKGVIQP